MRTNGNHAFSEYFTDCVTRELLKEPEKDGTAIDIGLKLSTFKPKHRKFMCQIYEYLKSEKRKCKIMLLLFLFFHTFFFSILYFVLIVIVYNSYAVRNNILIKIDGMVYSYIVEITNSYKYYIRNKLNLNY